MCERPTLLVSSEAVRIPEKGGMSIPIDAVNFVIGVNDLARERAKKRGHAVRHVHLVNDASMLAAHVASEMPTTQESIAQLRKLITNGIRDEFETKLKPYVDMRLKVLRGIADVFGRDFEIGTSLKLLREKTSRPMATRMMDIIGPMYRQSVDTYNLADMYAVIGRSHPSAKRLDRKTLRDIALSTVPPRLKNSLSEDQQLQESLYAAVEASFAAALIGNGGEYVAYKGSLKDEEGSSITENMRILVECTVWAILNYPDFAREIDHHFLIDTRLDGCGITTGDGGKRKCVPCDPHTLDFGDSIGQPKKLPFLVFDNGELRPVTPEEFRSAMVEDEGAGMSPEVRHAWVKNLPFLDDFLNGKDGIKNPEVQGLLEAKHVKPEALRDWATKIHIYLERKRKGEQVKNLSPLIPGGNINFTAELISLMAELILKAGAVMPAPTGTQQPSVIADEKK